MIISFVNQKGGVGKSTHAVHFSCWLQERGHTVGFFDADAQASSSSWIQDCGLDAGLDVIDPANTNRIPEQILNLARNSDITVCDGPGGLGEVTRTLLILSDVAVFPISASFLDAQSLQEAREQLAYANGINPVSPPLPRVLLNKSRKRSRLARQTRMAEQDLGMQLLGSSVRDLDAFRVAAQERTVVWRLGALGRAANQDLDAVYGEVYSLLSLPEVANA